MATLYYFLLFIIVYRQIPDNHVFIELLSHNDTVCHTVAKLRVATSSYQFLVSATVPDWVSLQVMEMECRPLVVSMDTYCVANWPVQAEAVTHYTVKLSKHMTALFETHCLVPLLVPLLV